MSGPQRSSSSVTERLLDVLDTGRRTNTYKLALLLAGLEVTSRRSAADGRPPTVLYTNELAERVAALYWPQVAPFRPGSVDEPLALRQPAPARVGILRAVRAFRAQAETVGAHSLLVACGRLPQEYRSMVGRIELGLRQEVLPGLQTVGTSATTFPFLYPVDATTRGPAPEAGPLGPRGAAVTLFDGAAEDLVHAGPMLRPLIVHHWTRAVADLNGLDTSHDRLRTHLFGADRRQPPRALRDWMTDLQGGRCFYCNEELDTHPEADHFLPRARCGLDTVENLVMAHRRCSADKRALLAAPFLVRRWHERNLREVGPLAQAARAHRWESDLTATLSTGRSIYAHLLPALHPFWCGTSKVRVDDAAAAVAALAATVADGRQAQAPPRNIAPDQGVP